MLETLQHPPLNGHTEVGKVILALRERIRPFHDQPRKYFDPVKLNELADGIREVGQLVPALVREVAQPDPDFEFELIDGQRRWHACDIAQVPTMKVIVVPVKDSAEQFMISVVSNFGRDNHTPLEIANAIKFFRDQGKTIKQVANIFAHSEAWVSQHIKLLNLNPHVQSMLSPNVPEKQRLGLSAALLLSDVPEDMQKKIADTIVGGEMKVLQARNFIRQRAEKMGFKVGDPERSPRKDYEVFRAFVGRMKREMEMFLEMPQGFFTKMFQFRTSEDHEAVVSRLESNIEQLQILVKALKKAKE